MMMAGLSGVAAAWSAMNMRLPGTPTFFAEHLQRLTPRESNLGASLRQRGEERLWVRRVEASTALLNAFTETKLAVRRRASPAPIRSRVQARPGAAVAGARAAGMRAALAVGHQHPALEGARGRRRGARAARRRGAGAPRDPPQR